MFMAQSLPKNPSSRGILGIFLWDII